MLINNINILFRYINYNIVNISIIIVKREYPKGKCVLLEHHEIRQFVNQEIVNFDKDTNSQLTLYVTWVTTIA